MGRNDLWLHHCVMALPLLSFSSESPGCGALGPLGTMLNREGKRPEKEMGQLWFPLV